MPNITSLEQILATGLGKSHPYSLTYPEKLAFVNLPWYATTVFGANAQIPCKTYLYRICSISTLILNTEWMEPESTRQSDEDEWNKINKRYNDTKTWVPLNEFAQGFYKLAPRIYSWWTSYPLYENVIPGAHKIGMVNEWVGVHTLALRCPVDYVNEYELAYVPSVIDAYTQPIFHPTRDTSNPVYGVTIDLSLYPDTLVPGTDEILLGPVATYAIEMLPIRVESSLRSPYTQVFLDDDDFMDLLYSYYSRL